MSEVDQLHYPVNHGVAQSHQGKDTADSQAVCQLLQKNINGNLLLLFGWPSHRSLSLQDYLSVLVCCSHVRKGGHFSFSHIWMADKGGGSVPQALSRPLLFY